MFLANPPAELRRLRGAPVEEAAGKSGEAKAALDGVDRGPDWGAAGDVVGQHA